MLTTSTAQYLHPEYLQPLPTTLDAKKSPLALLAQTCSSIGKDPSPNGKAIIPPIGKRESEKVQEKSQSPEQHKRPTSSGSTKTPSGRDSLEKPGFRTITSKEVPPQVPVSYTPGEKTRPQSVTTSEKSNENVTTRRNSPNVSVSPPVSTGQSVVNQRTRSPSRERETRESSTSASKLSSRTSPDIPSVSSAKPTSHPSISSLSGLPGFPHGYPGFPFMGHPYPGEIPSSAAAYPSPLAAHTGHLYSSNSAAAMAAAQNPALKHASSLSPYVTYARVRTPSGSTTLVPVCRDPYCTNCQLTMQTQHLSSQCTSPGCSQCAHEKSLQTLSGLGFPGSIPMIPGFSSASALSAGTAGLSSFPPSLASFYPPSALSAHQGLPFVCNWVSGNEYCGKRFTNSEELLQHLRTHTTTSDTASLAAAYSGLAGLPSGIHPGHLSAPGGLSPNSMRRAYPTSLSPVSSLLGASRYHPYKSPLMTTPGALAPGQSIPTIGPYYSPYTLYGQRLGAAAVP